MIAFRLRSLLTMLGIISILYSLFYRVSFRDYIG
jgi:hypothetical protein